MENIEKKIVEKKEINAKQCIKSIVIGFISYSIIGLFLCTFLSLVINVLLIHYNNIALTIIISFIESIFLYSIIHGICRLSTYDVFKKCKANPSNINNITKKMNLFFVICAILAVVISIIILIFKLDYLYSQIQLSKLQYSQVFSESFTNTLTNDMLENYNKQKTSNIISSVIIELSLIISIFSLIPYQRKMLNTYNTF